jgi:hypothetical protein
MHQLILTAGCTKWPSIFGSCMNSSKAGLSCTRQLMWGHPALGRVDQPPVASLVYSFDWHAAQYNVGPTPPHQEKDWWTAQVSICEFIYPPDIMQTTLRRKSEHIRTKRDWNSHGQVLHKYACMRIRNYFVKRWPISKKCTTENSMGMKERARSHSKGGKAWDCHVKRGTREERRTHHWGEWQAMRESEHAGRGAHGARRMEFGIKYVTTWGGRCFTMHRCCLEPLS